MKDYSSPYPYESERTRWLSAQPSDSVFTFLYGVALTVMTGLFWVVASQ